MSLKTMTVMSNSVLNKGWQSATITDAKYGTYNGTRYLDIWFENFPETLNHRVYEAKNKKTGEEFSIAGVFKQTNTIVDVLNDPTGKRPVIQYDDDPTGLTGKQLNIHLYKDGDYFRINRRTAPVLSGDQDKIEYTQKDVDYWKERAEKYLADRQNGGGTTFLDTSNDVVSNDVSNDVNPNTHDDDDDLPF